MPIPSDRETFSRFWHANGGFRGAKPVRPNTSSNWRPGQPVHWQEQSLLMQLKSYVIRTLAITHFVVSIGYLQYRARKTIGIFAKSRHPAWLTLQIAFFCYECFVTLFSIMQLPEHWKIVQRKCINFSQIPPHLITPTFHQEASSRIPIELKHFPSVDVLIPCYKEELHLVRMVVLGALGINYPSQLLSVYLCDDGRDPQKKGMVEALRRAHPNLHYVTRPDNAHAKPGNVNYTLERTSSHLVVQLDADFVARPQLIERLLSYYFVWNANTGLYEFNTTVGVVQTPQHYRNLSPHDQDLFDQRIIFYNNMTLPGKDWFNTSTMVGTANLVNREALTAAGNFPYHSFGDDTALSVIFHGLGYRTYFVNESLATGLCPVTLRGNLSQRARWYVTDSQILFSRHGPFTQRGLTFLQRIVYFNMALQRFYAIFNIFVDVIIILVLTTGFSVVDITEPRTFLPYLVTQLILGMMYRVILCIGIPGLFKSTAAYEAFETVFKYSTMKGVLLAIFNKKKLRWKVAEKVSNPATESGDGSPASSTENGTECQNGNNLSTPLTAQTELQDVRNDSGVGDEAVVLTPEQIERSEEFQVGDNVESSSHGHIDGTEVNEIREPGHSHTDETNEGRSTRTKLKKNKTQESKIETGEGSYLKFILMNLKRCWYNVMMAIVFLFALIWAILVPGRAVQTSAVVEQDGVRGRFEYNNLIPLALAFGFALSYLLAHVLAIVLCFKRPYVQPWILSDLQNGRCDQFAERKNGRGIYVPKSIISVLSLIRMAVILAAMIVVIVFSISEERKFVPFRS